MPFERPVVDDADDPANRLINVGFVDVERGDPNQLPPLVIQQHHKQFVFVLPIVF